VGPTAGLTVEVERKIPFPPLLGIDPSCPAHNLVTILSYPGSRQKQDQYGYHYTMNDLFSCLSKTFINSKHNCFKCDHTKHTHTLSPPT